MIFDSVRLEHSRKEYGAFRLSHFLPWLSCLAFHLGAIVEMSRGVVVLEPGTWTRCASSVSTRRRAVEGLSTSYKD